MGQSNPYKKTQITTKSTPIRYYSFDLVLTMQKQNRIKSRVEQCYFIFWGGQSKKFKLLLVNFPYQYLYRLSLHGLYCVCLSHFDIVHVKELFCWLRRIWQRTISILGNFINIFRKRYHVLGNGLQRTTQYVCKKIL